MNNSEVAVQMIVYGFQLVVIDLMLVAWARRKFWRILAIMKVIPIEWSVIAVLAVVITVLITIVIGGFLCLCGSIIVVNG